MDVSSGLALGLLAAAMWGTLDIVVAFAGRRVGGVTSAAAVVGTSCLLVVACGLAAGVTFPSDPRPLVLAGAAGAISSIGFVCFYTALRLGPVSIVSPTVAVYGGLASLLAVVVLGERPAPVQVAGAVAATIGIAFAGLTFGGGSGRPRFSGPGVPFALVSLVAWSVSIVALAQPIRDVGWLEASMVARVVNAILLVTLFLVLRRRGPAPADMPPLAPEPSPPMELPPERVDAASGRPSLRDRLGAHPIALLVAGGFLETAGFIAFAYGLRIAPAWLISLASSLGPLVTVTAGVLLFRERPRPLQWAGIGLVLGGIALVALG
jgi:drug/metabolite transporter (DMT)-like permease